jgi:DNA primase
MFPIRNLRGQVIGFGARALDNAEPKYLNSPETAVFRKGQELYGLHEAREAIRRAKRALVVEGYLDVIQLAQAGFEEAVAALGTAITPAHITVLFKLTDHVVFAFDGDAAGRKAARRALEAALPVLADTKRASFLALPDGEDPDSLIRGKGAKVFEELLEDAVPLSRYFVRAVGPGTTPESAEDRAAMVAEAKPLLLSMAPGALRMQLLRELADAARVSTDELHALYGLKRASGGRPQPLARRTRHAEMADLKRAILQQLLVQPLLAFEFAAAIQAEHGDQGERLDGEIVEVWRAATSVAPAASATINHGTLLELLAESPNAGEYRALAAQEMELDTDVETARQVLDQAFGKLRLRRLAQRRADSLAAYEQAPSADRLAAYQEADRAYLTARSQPVAAAERR